MSLKELYDNAAAGTYVGKVRTTQEESATAGAGVNFMDGTRRNKNNNAADEFQTEFTRRGARANVAGGAQPPVLAPATSNNSDAGANTNTRWTNKSFKLAFDGAGNGPDSLINGFYKTPTIFRKDNKGNDIHNYSPLADSRFQDRNTFVNDRINAGPTST